MARGFESPAAALILLLAVFVCSTTAADFTSWNRPTYSVNVLPPSTSPDPRVFGHIAETERKVEVVRVDGTKIVCDIPTIPEDLEDSNSQSRSRLTEEDVLTPLKSNCLYMMMGWWTYEFCYGKHVKQYHMETTGERTASFLLGKRLREEEEEEEGGEQGTAGGSGGEAGDGADELKEYYSHFYGGGTTCDLTGKPREVEVRFSCAPSERVGQMVGIKEPATCSYVLYVQAGLLCKHPAYAVKKTMVNHIICSTLDENGAETGGNDAEEVDNVKRGDPAPVLPVVEEGSHSALPTRVQAKTTSEQLRAHLRKREL